MKSTSGSLLKPHLLSKLSTELDVDNSVAVALTGRYAQGEANAYGYVDLVWFVTVLQSKKASAIAAATSASPR